MRGVKLYPDLHRAPRLAVSRRISLILLYVVMACTGTTFAFFMWLIMWLSRCPYCCDWSVWRYLLHIFCSVSGGASTLVDRCVFPQLLSDIFIPNMACSCYLK